METRDARQFAAMLKTSAFDWRVNEELEKAYRPSDCGTVITHSAISPGSPIVETKLAKRWSHKRPARRLSQRMNCPECERLEAQQSAAVTALIAAIHARKLSFDSRKPLNPAFLQHLLETYAKADAAVKELAEHRAKHNDQLEDH